MIRIFTKIYPYRLNIKRKDPVELEIRLRNPSNYAKQISLELIPDYDLCFDRVGKKKNLYKRLGVIKPKETMTLHYNVYPFTGIRPGSHRIKIIVGEHRGDFNVVADKSEATVMIQTV